MTTCERTYLDAEGYEHRYPHHDHDDGETITCADCGIDVPGCGECPAPPAGDDGAWAEIEARHAPDCEWARTRAHRLD
jgi:hypothetical protein